MELAGFLNARQPADYGHWQNKKSEADPLPAFTSARLVTPSRWDSVDVDDKNVSTRFIHEMTQVRANEITQLRFLTNKRQLFSMKEWI